MRIHKHDFEPGSYVACSDVFVLMGDGSEVPVAGYGVSRIKINGKVVRLENSLHVPTLDSDLLSTTRHACNGKGCTFLLGNSQMHLTFPEFSVISPIPADGDLRLDLEDLTEHDWNLPDFICNGVEEDVTGSLETLERRMKFLNHVF